MLTRSHADPAVAADVLMLSPAILHGLYPTPRLRPSAREN